MVDLETLLKKLLPTQELELLMEDLETSLKNTPLKSWNFFRNFAQKYPPSQRTGTSHGEI